MAPSTQVLLMTIVFFFNLLILCLWEFCLPVCLYTCVFSVHKEQKKMLDFLGQELQTVVSCHGGAGNEPRSFEDQQVHLLLSHLSTLFIIVDRVIQTGACCFPLVFLFCCFLFFA